MTTPAQALGVFAGKQYIVTIKEDATEASAFGTGIRNGDTVVIVNDDDSELPYFSKVYADGSIAQRTTLIAINRVNFTPVIESEGVKFEAATRTIETTVITVDRKLTPAEQVEIAAIIQKGN